MLSGGTQWSPLKKNNKKKTSPEKFGDFFFTFKFFWHILIIIIKKILHFLCIFPQNPDSTTGYAQFAHPKMNNLF